MLNKERFQIKNNKNFELPSRQPELLKKKKKEFKKDIDTSTDLLVFPTGSLVKNLPAMQETQETKV